MSVQIDTTAENNALRLVNQGVHPASPSVNHTLLYIVTGSNAGLYIKNDIGQQIGPFITGSAAGSSGRTLIEEKTPSGTGSVSFLSIPGTYKKLVLEMMIRSTNATTTVNGIMSFNGDTTDGNYRYIYQTVYAAGSTGAGGASTRTFYDGIAGNTAPANEFSTVEIDIVQYANTNVNKHAYYVGVHMYDTSPNFDAHTRGDLWWNNTNAINQITFSLSAGNFVSSSVLRLYGEM